MCCGRRPRRAGTSRGDPLVRVQYCTRTRTVLVLGERGARRNRRGQLLQYSYSFSNPTILICKCLCVCVSVCLSVRSPFVVWIVRILVPTGRCNTYRTNMIRAGLKRVRVFRHLPDIELIRVLYTGRPETRSALVYYLVERQVVESRDISICKCT